MWTRGANTAGRLTGAVSVLALLWVGVGPAATPAAATDCLAGSGTDGDPFLVASAADLAKVGSGTDGCDLDAHYRQTADVTLTAAHTPIGTDGSAFTGSYDGDGHRIRGLEVDTTTLLFAGMFGKVQGAALEGIRLVDVVIDSSTLNASVGALVGFASSTVTVTESSATGTVTSTGADSYVGGLIGFAGNPTTVVRSFADVDVSAEDELRVGGFLGLANTNVEITDAYAGGDVSGSNSQTVGGLVGDLTSNEVARVYARGVVSGTSAGGLVARHASSTQTNAFWDTETSGQATSAGDATGRTTAQMTTFTTFADAGWDIVDGWDSFDVVEERVWGICPRVNAGYPFLLWEYDSDPCTARPSSEVVAAAPPSVSCAPLPAAVGATVTCSVTGGDAGIDILWRAAYNPVFAEAGVPLDASGSGDFTFAVPSAAVGQELTVELVEWAAPVSLGVVGGPVPSSVPSGEGPLPVWPLLLAVLMGVGLLGHRMRAEG